MFDVKKYMAKKEKGLVKVVKVHGRALVTFKVFDAETGDELDPQTVVLSEDAVKNRIAELQEEINNLEVLLKDLEQAPEI